MLGISGVSSEEMTNDSQPSTSSTMVTDVSSIGPKISLQSSSFSSLKSSIGFSNHHKTGNDKDSNGNHNKESIPPGTILANQSAIFQQMLNRNFDRSEKDRCLYIHRVCLQQRIDGFEYCNRHILYDKSAPYKQCAFEHPHSHRRCPNNVKKTNDSVKDARLLCVEHSDSKPKYVENLQIFKQSFLVQPDCSASSANTSPQKSPLKSSSTTHPPPSSSAPHQSSLLSSSSTSLFRMKRKFEELEHLCPGDSKHRYRPDWEVDHETKKIVMNRSFQEKKLEAYCRVLYGDRSAYVDPFSVQVNQVMAADDFEQDSLSHLGSDPLRYAGHYSLGDIENSLHEKFVKIRNLQLLLAKTRPEILNLERELRAIKNSNLESGSKNGNSSTSTSTAFHHSSDHQHGKNNKGHDQDRPLTPVKVPVVVVGATNGSISPDPEEDTFLETVEEKLLRCKTTKSSNYCVYSKEKEKCPKQALPLSRYCQKHVLYDPQQCLFRPCGERAVEESTGFCLEPVVPYTVKRTCPQHVTLKYTNKDIRSLAVSASALEKASTSFDDATVAEDDAFALSDDDKHQNNDCVDEKPRLGEIFEEKPVTVISDDENNTDSGIVKEALLDGLSANSIENIIV